MKNPLPLLLAGLFSFNASAHGAGLAVGSPAPDFTLKNQEGKDFSFSSRKGQWTILYFYPKAETPGCTKQACAFRDSIGKIRELHAEVYGVSINSVQDQAGFHAHHKLSFDLLADDGKVTELYGAKMPILPMAKRWTFVVGPDLTIRAVDKDVDPVKDPEHVAETLKRLQKATP